MSAFCSTSIEQVDFPSTLEEIDIGVFSSCESLQSIYFPKNSKLKKIGYGAFNGCKTLTQIDFPASLEEIGKSVFNRCKYLHTIIFPKDSELRKIGYDAFCSTSIKYVDFPSTLEEIDDGAFYECELLQSIIFPKDSKLKEIGKYVFDGCKSLKEIKVSKGSKCLDIIKGYIKKNNFPIKIIEY